LENNFLVSQCVSKGENYFALGFHATGFAPFNPIYGRRGHSGQASELHFAHQAILSDFSDIISVLHIKSPLQEKTKPRILSLIPIDAYTFVRYYDVLVNHREIGQAA
jgi:hypothetical protein